MGARPRRRGIGAPAAHSRHSGARRNPGPAPDMRAVPPTVIPARSGGISGRAPSSGRGRPSGGLRLRKDTQSNELALALRVALVKQLPRAEHRSLVPALVLGQVTGRSDRRIAPIGLDPPLERRLTPALRVRLISPRAHRLNQLRPGNVSSATPDLSSSPFPIETISSYCAFVARASGKLRPASCASPSAIPESFAACDDEK